MELVQCTKCLLDTTAPNITFDKEGKCNYCVYFETLEESVLKVPIDRKKEKLFSILDEIKKNSKSNEYDCIIGLSGGVDSSYLCYMAKQWNLRPLLVHFDNGWNTEHAVKNIENITKILNYDLITYVLNWEEFKDLQRSFFKSNVLDLEMPTDQLIGAALYEIAYKKKIKYILSGHNLETEAINPVGWTCKIKDDYENLKDIHQQFGSIKIKTLPKLSVYRKYIYEVVFGIQQIILLNYIPYNKAEVKQTIIDKIGWTDYGWKHFESIFTRFYQGYILPNKANIDKRKMHLSNLVMSHQITKAEAVKEMEKESYPMSMQLEDREYVMKKLDFDEEFMTGFLSDKPIAHENYKTNQQLKIRILMFLLKSVLYIPVRILRFVGVLAKPIQNN
jgi:N-acetyl sugar amidotransferase